MVRRALHLSAVQLKVNMLCAKQIMFFLCLLCAILVVIARPDGGETHPLPGPGLAYGGIPYGSMSGNVAEFYRKRATPVGRGRNYNIDFTPIEQWLR